MFKLCCGDILKKGDKNLVEGHTEFSPKLEIVSLDFSVELNSSYICRSCLVKLKKRRALISHLREVNDSLRQIYGKSSNKKVIHLTCDQMPCRIHCAL